MKNKISGLLFIVLVSITFFSCLPESSQDVNQDRIHTTYELFYNSNTDKTIVVAQFRFGNATGTVLQLEEPAFVTFEGDELEYNILYGGHQKEYAGQLTGGKFSYTDADGNTFENDVPTYESVQFPQGLDTLPKSQAYDLVWDGTPLSTDQRVGLFIGSWTWGNDALFVQNDDNANNIVLGTDGLANVQTGQTTFYMDRTTQVDLGQGTSAGGNIKGKFRANNIDVIVTD